jgi:hypothetical protein
MVPRRISWGKAYGSVQPTKTGPLAGFIFGPPARRGNAVGEASSFRGSFLPTHCIRLNCTRLQELLPKAPVERENTTGSQDPLCFGHAQ